MQMPNLLEDFSGAKITSQQGVYLYDLISQIPDAKRNSYG